MMSAKDLVSCKRSCFKQMSVIKENEIETLYETEARMCY